MLEDSRIPPGGANVRAVDVPSPVAGYIARVDADWFGAVDIYDRKGGELVARILHLDPVGVSVGDSVEYGQSLGTQSNKGLPNAGKHVHMEMDTRYYQQSENYMEDLASGHLSINAQTRILGIEPRPIVDDGTNRVGESSDIVRQVQRTLNAEGFRGANNQPLQEDGVYRLSMQPAVINYQQARGLSLRKISIPRRCSKSLRLYFHRSSIGAITMQRRPIEISRVPRPRKIRSIARQKMPFAALSKASVEGTTIIAPALQQAARIWRRKTGYRGSITSYRVRTQNPCDRARTSSWWKAR